MGAGESGGKGAPSRRLQGRDDDRLSLLRRAFGRLGDRLRLGEAMAAPGLRPGGGQRPLDGAVPWERGMAGGLCGVEELAFRPPSGRPGVHEARRRGAFIPGRDDVHRGDVQAVPVEGVVA